MARISIRRVQKSIFEQIFSLYLSAAAAKGVKDKTLNTYKQHFRAISKRLDETTPIEKLTSDDLDLMILRMREEQLSDSSIKATLLFCQNPRTNQRTDR